MIDLIIVFLSLSSEVFSICDECTSSELGFNGTISSAIFAFATAAVRTVILSEKRPVWQEDFVNMLRKTELVGLFRALLK